MKKLFSVLMIAVLALTIATPALADKPVAVGANGVETAGANSMCTKIQSGLLTASTGEVLTTGYDKYGYNYQSHMFNGTYDSSDRNLDGTYRGQTGDYVDDRLAMKWSDDWLSNVDCDGDGKLDRGTAGISLGWLTNHIVGDYDSDVDGVQDAHYTDFVKIVWTGPGSPLWGQYTIIQEVYNDPFGGFHGLLTKVGAPGLGLNDQWTSN